MRAITQHAYGPSSVLKLETIDRPRMRDTDVLLSVHAASLHIGDWHLMTGLPYMVRAAGVGLRAPKARVRGMDVAGRVVATGPRVTRFQAGDEVFGVCDGSLAEYARASENHLALAPTRLTPGEAAAIPTSAVTALHALRDAGRVQSGQRVLVIGASGGVGLYAVQIAKVLGAHVTGVCSAAKEVLVRSVGADDIHDYTQGHFAPPGERYDLILDMAGNRSLRELRRALTPRGTLVIVGGEGGGRWTGGFERSLGASMLSAFVRHQLRGLVSMVRHADLMTLRDLIEAGQLRPIIDRSFPLSDAPAAMRHLESGQARGKIIVTI